MQGSTSNRKRFVEAVAMKIVLVVLVVGVVCAACLTLRGDAGNDKRWQAYKEKFGKNYKDAAEETFRRQVWEKNIKTIDQHNKEAAEGKFSYNMAENHLTDRTDEELASMLMTGRP